MDLFKMLTKGTNLSSTSTKKDVLILPSTGPARNPQTLVQDVIDSKQSRGKKRKRNVLHEAGDEATEVESIVPDFFTAQPTEQVFGSISKSLKKDSPVVAQTELAEVPFLRRSEDDCKRILHSHKLKVTLMNSSVFKSKKIKEKKSTLTQITPHPLENFIELRSRFKISRRLASNLVQQGYSKPTEVQLGTIPILLGNDEDRGLNTVTSTRPGDKSHVDLLTIAPTGSGKTLAFLIPLIQGLLNLKHQDGKRNDENAHLQAVILAPTHELADQITNEARKLVQGTGLRVASMQKGMQVLPSEDDTELNGVVKADFLVSTPLALANALTSRPFPNVQYLILDEADVLLDPLFREQTLSIWKSVTNPDLSVSLWSATIGSSIEHLAQEVITNRRIELNLPSENHHLIRLIAGLKDSSLPTISHRLIYSANEAGKLLAIRQILHPVTSDSSTPTLRPPFLIFTQSITRASALHSELLYDIPIEAGGSSRIAVLHSSLSPTARSEIMTRFRKGEIWILITTDLLSRGVDFRGVNGVVNYDIPTTSAAYVHRAGRTGRAGREGGMAITLYTKEDIPYMKNVANVIAASERVHGRNINGNKDEPTLPSWLLDALPDVSKKSKQILKKRGVEGRRAGNEGKSGNRISTKSGFQRKLENRRNGAREGSKRRKYQDTQMIDNPHRVEEKVDDEEWQGIED